MSKILLVDDDPLLVRMYQKKFELDGHQVTTAENGEHFFEVLPETNPDVILLDVMMPEMNGLDALKKLKADDKYKNLPVIMLTNVGSSEKDSEEAIENGAIAYLVKASYSPKEVVQKVNEIMSAYTKEVPTVKTKIKGDKSVKEPEPEVEAKPEKEAKPKAKVKAEEEAETKPEAEAKPKKKAKPKAKTESKETGKPTVTIEDL